MVILTLYQLQENVLTLGLDSSSDEEQEDVDDEEEALDDSSDTDEDDPLKPFVDDSDLMGGDRERDLPDERAWGKDKSIFYGTNVSDQIIRSQYQWSYFIGQPSFFNWDKLISIFIQKEVSTSCLILSVNQVQYFYSNYFIQII